jgi:tetratricopeptide (TPR) repeat protein
MQWDDNKTPDEGWGEVRNDGQSVYLDRNQTRKLLTGYPVGPVGPPFAYVHRQSLSVVDALENRIVMLFDFPKDDAGIGGDCGLATIQSHGPPPVYRSWGDYYAKRGEYEKAIASYEESLKLDPSNTALRQKLDETIKACKQENAIMLEGLKCGTH